MKCQSEFAVVRIIWNSNPVSLLVTRVLICFFNVTLSAHIAGRSNGRGMERAAMGCARGACSTLGPLPSAFYQALLSSTAGWYFVGLSFTSSSREF